MSNFVNLHVHSHYSVLQAIPTVKEIIDKAKELEQPAVALTDINNLFGVPEFQKTAAKSGVKPIFGVHIEIMEQSRFSPQRKEDPPVTKHSLVLLAKNFQGYQNLLKIVSLGYDDGSFGRFCADKTLLQKYSSDIIALSSDNSGEMYKHAVKGDFDAMKKCADFYNGVFEEFYIEIQDRKNADDKIANKNLIAFAREHNLPLAATNPVYYLNRDDSILLEIAECIRDKNLLDKEPGEGFSCFRTNEEIEYIFKEVPDALSNTLLIADMCNVEFPKPEDQSPPYPIPADSSAGDFLREKSLKELKEKLQGKYSEEYEKRLLWELDTVSQMGFPNYFLVVSDFVQYAKKNGILVGPGRGSAAGALLSYALGITNVDPLKYDLLFERFLNPERVSMPDIDIDFEDSRRDEVKQYLRTSYGADKTADVVTFGYNKAKAVLKDVGRVLDIPLYRVNQITGLVNANVDLAEQAGLHDNSDNKKKLEVPELKAILSGSSEKEKLWINYSIKLSNRIRNLGTHASALIVAGNTLNTVIPLFKDRSNTVTTAFEGKYLEENGLLKMDILGLSNLSIIKSCLDRIYRSRQIAIEIDEIPLDDEKVFETFTKGHTAGIFQFESDGMTSYMKQLKPTSVEDLIAMNALYRPGPMANIPQFIARKHGAEEIDCYHPNLEPVLGTTYGVIVYQEQVMQIARTLAGFSLGEADLVRRIMAKKNKADLEDLRPKWIKGAIDNGYDESLADLLFEQLIPFSEYAFNKSHAAAYSILAYQIAWLKTHYPAEFLASVLSECVKHEDVEKYLTEAKKLNIDVLMPDINKGCNDFEVEHKDGKTGIRFGYASIKGLGEQAAEEIIKERWWGGDFLSVEDFIERTAENPEIRKGATEILIKAGAFDSLFDKDRIMHSKAIYLNTANLNTLYQKYEKKNVEDSVFSLFSSEEMEAASDGALNTNVAPLTFTEDFKNEITVFGFYLTKKILTTLTQRVGRLSSYKNDMMERLELDTSVSLMGYVTDKNVIENPSNPRKSWGKFTLNTLYDKIVFFVFGERLAMIKNMLNDGSFVFLKARISERKNKQRSYEITDITLLNENSKPLYSELNIIFESDMINDELYSDLAALKKISQNDYKNNAHNKLKFTILDKKKSISASATHRVIYPSPQLDKVLENPDILAYWFA